MIEDSRLILPKHSYRSLCAWLGLAAMIGLAFAIRLYKLDAVPLRGDEAYSVMYWTATPFSESWQRLTAHEPAPVGAFTLYWIWNGLVGRSELATRYLSLLGNVAGMAVIIALARRLWRDWRLATLAGVLWLIHPYLIWHAQDARTYGVLSALTPLTFYWLLRAIDQEAGRNREKQGKQENHGFSSSENSGQPSAFSRQQKINEKDSTQRRKGAKGRKEKLSWRLGVLAVRLPCKFKTASTAGWRPYFIFQILALYIYYFEPFWMAAQLFYVLSLRRKAVLKRLFLIWAIIAVFYIPVLAQLYGLLFVSEYTGNATAANFSQLFTEFMPTLLLGENTLATWTGALLAGGLIAGLIWVDRRAETKRERPALLLLFWIGIPPLLLYGVSFFSDFFRPRYVTTVSPALILALIALAAGIAPRSRRILAAVLMTLLVSILSALEVNDYFHHDPPKAANLPALMNYLQEHSTVRDLVISSYVDPAIEYYYAGQGELFIMPIEWTPTTEAIQAMLATHESVILLAGEQTAAIGQLLQANAQHLPGDTYPGVTRYRNWVVDLNEIQNPLDVTFGDVARLRGYTLIGDSLLLLYWEALQPTAADYSVLLHLQSAPGAPVVALDHAIAGTIISTRTWTPGKVYRDPVALPIDLPPGEYALLVGFKTETGATLPVSGGNAPADGRYPMGTLVRSRPAQQP